MLSASAGLKKVHMTKNAGFYIVSLVGKVLLNPELVSLRAEKSEDDFRSLSDLGYSSKNESLFFSKQHKDSRSNNDYSSILLFVTALNTRECTTKMN